MGRFVRDHRGYFPVAAYLACDWASIVKRIESLGIFVGRGLPETLR